MAIEIATTKEIEDLKAVISSLENKIDYLARAFEAKTRKDMPDWFTVSQAAEYLHLAPDTIRRKARSGHYEIKRDGKNILIKRDCLID